MRGNEEHTESDGSFHSSENQRLLLLRTTHLTKNIIQVSFEGRSKAVRDQGETFHVRNRR